MKCIGLLSPIGATAMDVSLRHVVLVACPNVSMVVQSGPTSSYVAVSPMSALAFTLKIR